MSTIVGPRLLLKRSIMRVRVSALVNFQCHIVFFDYKFSHYGKKINLIKKKNCQSPRV